MDMPYTTHERDILIRLIGLFDVLSREKAAGIVWDDRLSPTVATANSNHPSQKMPTVINPIADISHQDEEAASFEDLDLGGLEYLTKDEIIEHCWPELPFVPGEPQLESITTRTLESWIKAGFFPAADDRANTPHRWHHSTIQQWFRLRGDLTFKTWDKTTFLNERGRGWPANPRK